MVGTFRHKGLEELYSAGSTRRIGARFIGRCIRILRAFEAVLAPEEMNIAGFRFHALHANPARWSVRVSGNYRITFGWKGEEALDIDFEDYH